MQNITDINMPAYISANGVVMYSSNSLSVHLHEFIVECYNNKPVTWYHQNHCYNVFYYVDESIEIGIATLTIDREMYYGMKSILRYHVNKSVDQLHQLYLLHPDKPAICELQSQIFEFIRNVQMLLDSVGFNGNFLNHINVKFYLKECFDKNVMVIPHQDHDSLFIGDQLRIRQLIQLISSFYEVEYMEIVYEMPNLRVTVKGSVKTPSIIETILMGTILKTLSAYKYENTIHIPMKKHVQAIAKRSHTVLVVDDTDMMTKVIEYFAHHNIHCVGLPTKQAAEQYIKAKVTPVKYMLTNIPFKTLPLIHISTLTWDNVKNLLYETDTIDIVIVNDHIGVQSLIRHHCTHFFASCTEYVLHFQIIEEKDIVHYKHITANIIFTSPSVALDLRTISFNSFIFYFKSTGIQYDYVLKLPITLESVDVAEGLKLFMRTKM